MQFDRSALLHTHHNCTSLQLAVARTYWSRFRGLMLTRALQRSPHLQGLLIPHCVSVHAFFMRYPLDVAYLAQVDATPSAWCVTQVERLRPWRISWSRKPQPAGSPTSPLPRGTHVLELPAGTALALNLCPGDRLELLS